MLLPEDPLSRFPQSFVPAARRQMTLFGAPVELLYLPQRKARQGVPQAGRPAFPRQQADRILREEGTWEGSGMVMTGNRYPFARRQAVFWAKTRTREPDVLMLELLLRLEERGAGTVLMNTVGASASISRCHMHLVDERLGFLGHFDVVEQVPHSLGKLPPGVNCFSLAAPFPGLGVGVRGPARERAAVVHDLLHARSTPAFNLVSQDATTWVFPRSAVEIPAPYFPHAVGAAEYWGRWCFPEEGSFQAATPGDLETALRLSCYPL